MPHTALLLALSTLTLSAGAWGASERSVATPCVEEGSKAPAPGRRALAGAAVLLPGFAARGAGAWVVGRPEVAERLLSLQALGLGGTLVGLTGLALSGAATVTAGPLVLLTAGGVSMLGSTWLLDGYVVAAAPTGFGHGTQQLPLLRSSLGYQRIVDPVFGYEHFATERLEAFVGRTHLTYGSSQAPGQGYASQAGALGLRLWGQGASRVPAQRGRFGELMVGGQRHDFPGYGFATDTADFLFRVRIDSEELLAGLEGAFIEWDAGVALRRTRIDGVAVSQTDTALLGAHRVGFYLGDAGPQRDYGEVTFYYDHRHDTLTGGLKASGLGSGTAGHFGLHAIGWLDSGLGASVFSEFGSAWTTGVAIHYQVWGRGPEGQRR